MPGRGVDIAQPALQFALAYRGVATTVVGSANVENLLRNVRWAEREPDIGLMDQFTAFLAPIHGTTSPSGRSANNFVGGAP